MRRIDVARQCDADVTDFFRPIDRCSSIDCLFSARKERVAIWIVNQFQSPHSATFYTLTKSVATTQRFAAAVSTATWRPIWQVGLMQDKLDAANDGRCESLHCQLTLCMHAVAICYWCLHVLRWIADSRRSKYLHSSRPSEIKPRKPLFRVLRETVDEWNVPPDRKTWLHAAVNGGRIKHGILGLHCRLLAVLDSLAIHTKQRMQNKLMTLLA
jgi:hypothetical protein